MNRHHPYGGGVGGYENAGARRGGAPAGPGPDRSYRFERGGAPSRGGAFSRGRGGGGNNRGSFEAPYGQGLYDQGSPTGDVGAGPYSNYNAGPPQDPFFQNGYGGGAPPQFGAPPIAAQPPLAGAYNQGYGSFEDSGPSLGDDGAGYNRPIQKRNARQRDDKVHDSIIEERLQRERPCRTLFIRNIKYETNSDDIRRQFEEYGEIKTFFDLISTRGMVFVTYFDLRAAERARDRLQGSEISGRPIDVHYSLPRDDRSKGGNDQSQMQGTLLVSLYDSVSNQPIDDNELRRKFQQFGDVKSVTPVGDRPDQRYVEFYDIRACDDSYERLRNQSLQDGVMDIAFAWDKHADDAGGSSGPKRNNNKGHDGGREWEDRGPQRGRGGRGWGRGRGGRGGFDDDWDRRDNGRDHNRRGRFDDDYGGGREGMYNDGFDQRNGRGNDGGGYGNGGYGGPATYNEPPSNGYGQTNSSENERLEQAKKVQQLLAALKQPQTTPGAPVAPIPPPPGPGGMPPYPPTHPVQAPPPPPNPYYGAPPASALSRPPYPGPPPPPNPYGQPPPQPSTPQPGPGAAASFGNLPPNILALLQRTAQTQQSPPPPPPHQGPPPGQYGMPPPGGMPPGMMQGPPSNVPPAPADGGPGYQELMAYLQSQAAKH